MLKAAQNSFLSLFFPQACHLCSAIVDEKGDGVACSDCWTSVRFFTGLETICAKCGLFLSDTEPLFETFCRRCTEHAYDAARAVGHYQGAMAASVLQLKRTPITPERLAKSLRILFSDTFQNQTTLIVPVPLSKKRLHERGYNQASVLGRILSKASSIPMDEFSLVRKVHTQKHRAAMDKKKREITVRKAFEVKRPKMVEGQHILLVDDVLTSGATASFCARALKKNGAASVNVLTLARAVSTLR